jgi:hypothetical protein
MIAYWVKNALRAAIGIAIAFGVSVGIGSVACWALDQFGLVYPSGETDIAEWLDSFKTAFSYGTGVALIIAMVWIGIALYSSGRKSDKRHWWELLLVLATAAAGWLSFYLPLASESAIYPTILGGSGGALCFLIATIPFTPDPLKYSPWFARAVLRLVRG